MFTTFASCLTGYYIAKLKSAIEDYISKKRSINKESASLKAKSSFLKSDATMYLLATYLILYFDYTAIRSYIDLQLNDTFTQRVTIIAPYISEQEEEELKSKWASMNDRNDYLEINQIIEQYAKENSITLPKLLYK